MKVWQATNRDRVQEHFFEFQRSLPFDIALLEEEMEIACAWADALQKYGTLTPNENKDLKKHLALLAKQARSGLLNPPQEIEDVHSLVEDYLTQKVGDAGKKLHTGRSRNDLAPATLRLFLMKRCSEIKKALAHLQSATLGQAEKGMHIVCPFYTHQQPAEPVRLSHYWLAHFFRLQRDRERLDQLVPRIAQNPLGAGAGSGSFINVSPRDLQRALGFQSSLANALDATSSRDFATEFLAWACLLMIDLSALAQDILFWTSAEHRWARLPSSLTTGSSLLPHKRNADGAELVRAKTGRVIGNFVALASVLKALPSGYAKDLQEDKERVFDTVNSVHDCLSVMTIMVRALKFDARACARELRHRFLGTVALVACLVDAGVPFRDAYREVAGWARARPSQNQKPDFSRFADRIPAKILSSIADPLFSIEARKVSSGCSLSATRRQIARARKLLKQRPA